VQPTAQSLILDLLSSVRGQPIPVRALVAAGELFDISAESIRVALVRLCVRGTIAHNERGRYCLAARAEPVQAHVTSWTHLEDRLVPWRGGWIGVHTGGLERTDRTRVRRRERALDLLGFRLLDPHLFVRPDNLRGGVDAARVMLRGLGLVAAALVFALAELDDDTERRARTLWDGAALCRDYRATIATLTRSAAGLERMPSRQAMTESFVLGGHAIRQLAHDPLLPEPIVPAAERVALVEQMRIYDRLGRELWRGFMHTHRAPHLRAPRTAVPVRATRRAVGATA